MDGLIFNIQKYSITNGPGIRSTVFFKGCNLRCPWCHNLESLTLKTELMWDERKCSHCKICVSSCTEGAFFFTENKKLKKVKDIVVEDFSWAENCPNKALEVVGKSKEVSRLVDYLAKGRAYFENSNGGVTFSGGEPLLQSDFVMEAFKLLKEKNITTALDTAGFVPWSNFEKVLPFTDYVLLDMKIFDPTKCKEILHGNLNVFLENLEKLKEEKNIKIYIRVPLIKGLTDSRENIDKILELLDGATNIEEINLLPYHNTGVDKGNRLFSIDEVKEYSVYEEEELEEIKKIFDNSKFKITLE